MKRWIIGFFILQIGLDLAHSLTAFPFVHSGMFSAKMARPDSVAVLQVRVDGQLLRPGDLPPYQWDMVLVPLETEEKRAATGDYAFDKERMAAGLRAIGLGTVYNQLKPNLSNTGDFASWYKAYLSRLLGRPIGVLQVDRVCYRWTTGKLVWISTENRFHA